ncbi:Trehalose recp domain containing protein, partial [Asbolus verrucosus]
DYFPYKVFFHLLKICSSNEDIIHITTAALSFLFFVQLARQWPELIRKWCDLDEKFNSIYRYPRFLKLKLCLVTAVYTVLIFGKCVKNSINFWMTLRRNYSEMGNLCSDINDKLSNIIVLSYGSNMMLLLIQLRTFIRLWGVYYFSSRINTESRRPVRILFAVSTETYNIEVMIYIAGAIVTYELIFIQFSQSNK